MTVIFNTEEQGIEYLLSVCSTMLIGFGVHLGFDGKERKFKANFGCSLQVASKIWILLDVLNEGPRGGQVKHMLWALMFLKVYATEEVLADKTGVHRDTYRKWVWLFVPRIASIEVVSNYCHCLLVFINC
jgi:hypothetical protein